MLELMFCAMLTVLPDYLYRRYVQGKRFGKEITLYSVWFELRWGITTCLILTVSLITIIFYNHPSTKNVTMLFRTVPILPETMNGRVAEVYVGFSGRVKQGEPLFKLDSSRQEADVATARRKIAEVDAATQVARAEVDKAAGQLKEAESNYQQTLDELETKRELYRRDRGNVPLRDIERLEVRLEGNQGAINAATAAKKGIEDRIAVLLPAEKASAEAALKEAQVELDKTVIRAGVSGQVQQFTLRVGDVVNPLIRSAGVLIPEDAGQRYLQAGFNQIEAQVIKTGMIAEVTCISQPFTVIPMVVTIVQSYIAAGQIRTSDQLFDPQQVTQPGTLLTTLEPLYEGGLDNVVPGSSCIANAYSNNHDVIVAKDTGTVRAVALHAVDALALVHALILRLQALVLPFQTLVLGGH